MNSIVAKDKQLHFLAGAVIAFVFTTCMFVVGGDKEASLFIGFLMSCVAGVGKEAYDYISEKGNVEMEDFLYTALGGGVMCLVIDILS